MGLLPPTAVDPTLASPAKVMHWSVIGPGVRSRHSLCRCVCGVEKEVRRDHLRTFESTSCGCAYPPRNLRHGHAKKSGKLSPTYGSWSSMVRRCTNAEAENYSYYGGRGIRVCESWLTFDNFLRDMGERPAGKTIDRINVEGHYEPGNCRWADWSVQCENKRRRHGRH